ncbi:GDSL-type esterase/lipase family protein [Nesterenkonia flava]|uniref:SGNH/GDSL hydrolase family protein n=1 Tax=Nesterenkonia flava TaxID=469799 RepID=A0ABU1FX10_9MICC|nr:GDSL-type esterase/lipase family protein [Nesterenkonia flava]MDR5712792.1 SGNH/GDSL hydrolase family protein [Nesterenkonia flava]
MQSLDAHTIELNSRIVRGAVELEPTARGLLPRRLPGWALEQNIDPMVERVTAEPSGVRLEFLTRAGVVELEVYATAYAGEDWQPAFRTYDLVVDGVLHAQASATSGRVIQVDPATRRQQVREGSTSALRFEDLPAGEKHVEIWLPNSERTELVSLRADAPLAALNEDRAGAGQTRWLHHGSSISQGSDAAHPTGIWPAVAARAAGVHLQNLGFGGQAVLDPFTARTLRETPADVITLKLGINLVNGDIMRRRAFTPAVHGFLDTIREGQHASTPLVVVSPLHCAIHEQTPGALRYETVQGQPRFSALGDPAEVAQGRLSLEVIREDLAAVVAARQRRDENLYFLSGLELFGAEDEQALPMPDQLHPDTAAHRLIGERFAQRVFGPAGILAGRF